MYRVLHIWDSLVKEIAYQDILFQELRSNLFFHVKYVYHRKDEKFGHTYARLNDNQGRNIYRLLLSSDPPEKPSSEHPELAWENSIQASISHYSNLDE